ncbi:hypothetical protein BJX65DRAFT_305984 [Aspergillus insuetus]
MKSPFQILTSCLSFTWVTSYKTIEVIGSKGITTEAVNAWLEYRRGELNFTAIISSPPLSPPASHGPAWKRRTGSYLFWYNAGILAIFSAIMAYHQSSALGFILAKVFNGNRLGDALLKKGTIVPSKTADFVLQAPIQILTYGIAMYLIGYLTYVVYPISQAGYPADPAKIALFFEVLLFVSCGFFVTSLVLLQRLINAM